MTTKYRLATPANADVHGPAAPKVQVLDTSTGVVSWVDKAKGYYKGIITAITAVLVIANQLTPIFDFLPVQDKGYITAGIAIIGTVVTFLKANEHWVDDA